MKLTEAKLKQLILEALEDDVLAAQQACEQGDKEACKEYFQSVKQLGSEDEAQRELREMLDNLIRRRDNG